MSGPSAPSAPGTMRVPREKSRRQRASSLGLRGREERFAEAERDRTADDRELRGRAGSRPTRPRGRRACPCARRPRAARRAGGRPVMRAIAVPDASASTQPRAPHPHSCPSGSTMTWPMWPALPVGAVEQPAVEHDAAADAGRHDHADVVAHAARRAEPAFAERERLGVVVDEHRQARVRSASRARNGKSRHAGMLSGDTCSPPRVHRSAAADADRDGVVEVECVRASATSAANSASASSPSGVGTCVRSRIVAVVAHDGRGELGAADVDGKDAHNFRSRRLRRRAARAPLATGRDTRPALRSLTMCAAPGCRGRRPTGFSVNVSTDSARHTCWTSSSRSAHAASREPLEALRRGSAGAAR